MEQKRPHFRLGPIDLDIPKGYVTAIVGPNGSGKSSTFRLLLDLAKPDAGEIEQLGERLGVRDDAPLKRRIGGTGERAARVGDTASEPEYHRVGGREQQR